MSSIPRFFVPAAVITGDSVKLPADAAHHAANVLRLREGEAVILHDNTGMGYACRLTHMASKTVIVQVESRYAVLTEPRTRITIAQALPKTGEKIEQVLQHGTEVGADSFILFPADRSVARMDQKDKVEKRLERWSGIVQGAAEQSGRGKLPTVQWETHLSQLTRRFGEWDVVILLHEAATESLRKAIATPSCVEATRILFFVGPEGGFTEGEVAGLIAHGAISVTLGARILRTETAALVALSQILFFRDE